VSLLGNTPSAIVYLGSYNKLRDVGTDLFHPHNFFARSILVPTIAGWMLVGCVDCSPVLDVCLAIAAVDEARPLAGAIADATSVVVCTPFDVVTTHMQRVNGHYTGRLPSVLKQIWHQEGAFLCSLCPGGCASFLLLHMI
jgi:hypothetical protein